MEYIILLVAAILALPILIYIVRRKRISNRFVLGTIAGLCISFIGLVMQRIFDPPYVLVAMFGLAFAVSVLLDKRSEPEAVTVSEHPVVKDIPREIIHSTRIDANEELAASVDKDIDFSMEPIEDGLNQWMSANREEIESEQSEYYDRKEGSDGK
ncbi:hypothetical protein [Sporosarcina sp. E16_8]|uniref:hypothetical protein n=1 Tax=Sporosarcina sp. E16_8 TaxID=2789295 RepID=UPI001A933F7A|nr:hypothetical protein [Sporosarcina sp. E16_8]MBO0587099.1 hypothetical protein [Sporosarcina sp. E16_8]